MIFAPLDKTAHFWAGLAIMLGVSLFGGWVLGLSLAIIAAIGKEIYDWFHRDKHTPEVMDAIVTILGGLTGLICCI